MLGTDDKYRAYRERLNAAMKEAKAKGLTLQQMKDLEDKMIQQAEIDGVKAEAEVESRAKWGGREVVEDSVVFGCMYGCGRGRGRGDLLLDG